MRVVHLLQIKRGRTIAASRLFVKKETIRGKSRKRVTERTTRR